MNFHHITPVTVRTVRGGALALTLGLGCALSGTAQTTGERTANPGTQSLPGATGTPMDRPANTRSLTGTALTDDANRTTRRDGDWNWGWAGLLGLAGLAGLRGKQEVRHEHEVDRDRGRTTPTAR